MIAVFAALRRLPSILLLVVLFSCLAGVRPLHAQGELDAGQPPNFGTYPLASGFSPDPARWPVTGGGSVDAAYLGGECRGFASRAPDLRLTFTAGTARPLLRFFFVGEGDTTLIVNDASGNWRCSDDSFGTLHPTVDFTSPESGTYDIWVGTFTGGETAPGTLYVTELSANQPGALPTAVPAAAPGALEYGLDPIHGRVALAAGFSPDPYTVTVTAGGTTDVTPLGQDCRGYTYTAPDFSVNYTAGNQPFLRFFFVGAGDTALIVNGPGGEFLCSDDTFGTLNGTIAYANPLSGEYDVWVTSWVRETPITGTLYVTEQTSIDPGVVAARATEQPGAQPGAVFAGQDSAPPGSEMVEGAISGQIGSQTGGPIDAQAGEPAADGNARYGSFRLSAGFAPDPLAVAVTSGGTVDIAYLGADCHGYAAEIPDVHVDYTAGMQGLLRVFFVGSEDTTLVVATPAGEFVCNDDSFGTRNPTLDIANPSTGAYDIWVASWGETQRTAGALYITESAVYNPASPALPAPNAAGAPPTPTPGVSSARYGSVALTSGFAPDPYTRLMTVGGTLDASYLGGLCRGFTNQYPDFDLVYTAGATRFLRMYYVGAGDTTLIVSDPSGRWVCSDDAYGVNPAVDFDNPASGQYSVWVGTRSAGTYVSGGTLYITEASMNHP